LKSIQVGPRSRVVNEEFAEKHRIRTTLVDFLLGLVAPRVGDVAPNWVNKLPVPFAFLSFILLYYLCLLLARCSKHLIQHL
jgi:hypothetical protein